MAYIGAAMADPSNPSADSLTPAMRQYAEQKAAVPDALLLFRMGDFYETFYEDARTAASVLGIALTSRGKDRSGEAVPLAGIPYHALDNYLRKLVAAGCKVAISEQVEDPRLARGVVRREIVRIVTPGTLTEDALLERQADNYLVAVCARKDEVGLAFVDLSSGVFCVQRTEPRDLADELVRLGPAEVLLPESRIDAADPVAARVEALTGAGGPLAGAAVSRRPAHVFDPYQAHRRLLEHFRVASLEGFGFPGMDASLCAAGAVIDYLAETQKTALRHIVALRRREPADFVGLDEATWRSLEIERTLRGGQSAGSLLSAVDRTCTGMGARCLRRWLAAPLRDVHAIRARQDAVAALVAEPHVLAGLRGVLRRLADIERITARLGVGRASPRDMASLAGTLLAVEEAGGVLDGAAGLGVAGQSALPPYLADRRQALVGLTELGRTLSAALAPTPPLSPSEGGVIADGHDAELDRLRAIGSGGQQWLADFQAAEIRRTGIPSLKVGFNQVFGYYIEITHAHRQRVPPDYVRKQTLKNAERYITDELKRHETEVLTAREQAIAREIALFEQLRNLAAEHIPALQRLATAVAEVDVVAGLAELADKRRYVRPEFVNEPVLEISDGRHPVLEQSLAEKFVPNDCRLGLPPPEEAAGGRRAPETLVILTGPNMAGKSTYIRQVALLTLLAQTGSFVPAGAMRLGPVDRIFARVGAADDISRGQSTFMVEMTEAANILHNATGDSLVVIDELGRGTSTFDGLALAWAIAERLAGSIRCRTLFATHYHEMTRLEEDMPGVINCNVAVREWEDQIVFLHRIVRGGTDRSYGPHVARLAGVPEEVIARSRVLLEALEAGRSAPPAAARSRETDRPARQLLLFDDPAEEILRELAAMDPDRTTPVEALAAIDRWRRQLGRR